MEIKAESPIKRKCDISNDDIQIIEIPKDGSTKINVKGDANLFCNKDCDSCKRIPCG